MTSYKFWADKIKRRASALPLPGLFSGLLRGAIGFSINVVVDAVAGLHFLIHVRAAAVLTHGVFMHFIGGHVVVVH